MTKTTRYSIELYQNVKFSRGRTYRRIALLPDVDDNLVQVIKSYYKEPRFTIRVVTYFE